MAGREQPKSRGRREITPPLKSQSLFAHDLVDGGKRLGRLGEVAFSALRVGLIEKLVHLLGVLLAQGIGVDLVLYGLLGGRELLGALIVPFGRLVNGVGGPPIRQARLAPITTRLSIVVSPLEELVSELT